MNNEHPIKKQPEPIPHDPRNEPIPEPEEDNGSRSAEEAERKARKEEGLDMKGARNMRPTGMASDGSKTESPVTEDEYGLPTGIPKAPAEPASSSTGAHNSPDQKTVGAGKPDAELNTDQQLAGIIPPL